MEPLIRVRMPDRQSIPGHRPANCYEVEVGCLVRARGEQADDGRLQVLKMRRLVEAADVH